MIRRRRTAREIASEQSGRKRNSNQLWVTVGVALFAIVAIVAFRHSCGKKLSGLYEGLTPPKREKKIPPLKDSPTDSMGGMQPGESMGPSRPAGQSANGRVRLGS